MDKNDIKMKEETKLEGIKVLIVDDSSTIRRSAEIFLSDTGCKVITAENGFDAMAKIVDNHPNIIFVDIVMPRLDGYQACQMIKKIPITIRRL